MSKGKKSALLVCLGNICRSPIAEACMKKLVHDQGKTDQWFIDSAATGDYQIGNPPYHLGQKCMKKHGIFDYVKDHRARQITQDDFNNFDYIFGMDDSNMSDLRHYAPKGCKANILKLGSFNPSKRHGETIQDPYYSGDDNDFDIVYEQCLQSCKGFLDTL